MIVTLNANIKARIQSIDLDNGVITFQQLDADEQPIGDPGQHGTLDTAVLAPVAEALAAEIAAILPSAEEE